MKEIYYKNDVEIPPKYVDIEATRKIRKKTIFRHDLSPKDVLREKNAEVRREILRHVGIERFLGAIEHKVIDTEGDYSLIEIPIQKYFPTANSPVKKMLKMKNPSIGTWHIEIVENSCQTVQDALDSRGKNLLEKNEHWSPEYLT